ncbi:MAG: hypothetical protein F9K47_07325 [Burkholderiales bacterium]|nr:MAG: hypothetical protein F9K47_07325 [Burkholderiales bacterium]
MFESTIDSSVYPRKAYWGACGFGSLEQCLNRAIKDAAMCEGGALQGPSDRWTPEQYIESWLAAFAQPLTLARSATTCKVDALAKGVYCYTDEESAQRLRDVKALLASQALGGEEAVTVDLETPLDRLAALLNDAKTPIASWCFFNRAQCREPICQDAAYLAEPIKAPRLPSVYAYRLPARPGEQQFERDYLVGVGGESPRLAGWAYAAVEELIRRVAPAVEQEQPGAAVATMSALRAAVRNAPEISAAQPLRVERPPNYTYCHYSELFAQVARENNQPGQQVIVVTAAALIDPNNSVSRLPTSWITMPDTPMREDTLDRDDEPSFGALA